MYSHICWEKMPSFSKISQLLPNLWQVFCHGGQTVFHARKFLWNNFASLEVYNINKTFSMRLKLIVVVKGILNFETLALQLLCITKWPRYEVSNSTKYASDCYKTPTLSLNRSKSLKTIYHMVIFLHLCYVLCHSKTFLGNFLH